MSKYSQSDGSLKVIVGQLRGVTPFKSQMGPVYAYLKFEEFNSYFSPLKYFTSNRTCAGKINLSVKWALNDLSTGWLKKGYEIWSLREVLNIGQGAPFLKLWTLKDIKPKII